MLQKEGNTGLTVIQREVHLDLVRIGDISHQVRESFGCLPCAQMALIGWRELNNGNHTAAARPGVPTLYEFTRTLADFRLPVDVCYELLFGPLELPQHFQ